MFGTCGCLYTLLYLKSIISKDLLYSTGNSAQCYMAVWMGGEFGGNGCIYIYTHIYTYTHGWVPLLFIWNYHNIVNYLDTSLSSKIHSWTLGFTLGIVHSVGLDKCIITYIHHYSIIWHIFTALKVLCAPSLRPCPSPWQPLIFLLPPEFWLYQNVI